MPYSCDLVVLVVSSNVHNSVLVDSADHDDDMSSLLIEESFCALCDEFYNLSILLNETHTNLCLRLDFLVK